MYMQRRPDLENSANFISYRFGLERELLNQGVSSSRDSFMCMSSEIPIHTVYRSLDSIPYSLKVLRFQSIQFKGPQIPIHTVYRSLDCNPYRLHILRYQSIQFWILIHTVYRSLDTNPCSLKVLRFQSIQFTDPQIPIHTV